MSFLIFGPERPKLSFKQLSKTGTIVQCDNEYVLKAYAPDKPITWRTVACVCGIHPGGIPTERDWGCEDVWRSIIKKLKILCQTDSERTFLDKITAAQKARRGLREGAAQAGERFYKSLLDEPALIPQVWLNWIHYDSKDKQRSERMHLEPFRVDFLYQGKSRWGSFKKVIVEIDDIWHIADVEKYVDDVLRSSRVKADPSLEKFTEHLRKDRWLRRHGWEVSRFSTLEVEKENYNYLYCEMLMLGGSEKIRPSPSYFPHKE